MGIKDIFNKSFETHDSNNNDLLKTHYYRCRYSEAVAKVKDLIESEKAQLVNEDHQYHEYLFKTGNYDCICTITEINPTEIAIDFKIETYDLLSFGKGKKLIARFYEFLNNNLSFKGLGLFKG